MSKPKTNAMRILDSKKIEYQMLSYDNDDGMIDGISVANKIGKDISLVYKTLVAQGNSKNIYVFIIPVAEELDLKKSAIASEEKKIEMIPTKDIQKWTGYIRGGCSPIGMKKLYKTFIDDKVLNLDEVVVSGGKIGVQIAIKPQLLIQEINAKTKDLIKNK